MTQCITELSKDSFRKKTVFVVQRSQRRGEGAVRTVNNPEIFSTLNLQFVWVEGGGGGDQVGNFYIL